MNGDIRADYAVLPVVAGQLYQEAERVRALMQQLQQRRAALQNAWQGRGAAVFFNEMDTTVLPEFARLTGALDQSSVSLKTIQQIFQLAEEEAARLLQMRGGAAGSETSAGEAGSFKSLQPTDVSRGPLPQEGGDGEPKPFPPGSTVIVTNNNVNFRQRPTTNNPDEANPPQLASGDALTVVSGPHPGENGDTHQWYLVQRADGSTGYVTSDFLERYVPIQYEPGVAHANSWMGGFGCGPASVLGGLIFKGVLSVDDFGAGMDWFDEHATSDFGVQPGALEDITTQYLTDVINPQRRAAGLQPLSVGSEEGRSDADTQRYIEAALSKNETVIVDVLCTGVDAATVIANPSTADGEGAYAHFMQVDSLVYDENGVLTAVRLADTVSGTVTEVPADVFWASMENPEVKANDVAEPEETTNWVMTIHDGLGG